LSGNSMSRIAGLPRPGAANTALLQLRRYAPFQLLYSIGMGATAAENYGLLRYLCRDIKVKQDTGEERPLSRVALPWNVLDVEIARQMPGYERHYTPVNDRMFDVLRESLREYFPGDSEYEEAFDRFEYLVALIEFDQRGEMWAPVGRFGWRSRLTKSIVELLSEDAKAQGE